MTETTELTREAILAMPAGREMDAWIAHKIFGWDADAVEQARRGEFDRQEDEGGHKFLAGPALYSTDIGSAFDVVAHLENTGLDWEARNILGGVNRFAFYDLRDVEPLIANGVGYAVPERSSPDTWNWPVDSPSLPLSICRAALIAVTVGVKGPFKPSHD